VGDESRRQHPAGSARSHAPVPLKLGHTHRRSFLLVIVACWIVGFFGLQGGRLSVIQLLVSAGILLAWLVIGAHRRHVEAARERWLRSGFAAPRPSVSVRRYGERY
jgi:hypothetical protein